MSPDPKNWKHTQKKTSAVSVLEVVGQRGVDPGFVRVRGLLCSGYKV